MNPFPHLNFPFLMTFTWKHATLFKTWSLGKRRWSKWKRLGNSWDSKGKMNQRNSSCFSASTFRNIGIWRESVVFLVGGCFESLTMNWVFFFWKNLLKLRKSGFSWVVILWEDSDGLSCLHVRRCSIYIWGDENSLPSLFLSRGTWYVHTIYIYTLHEYV